MISLSAFLLAVNGTIQMGRNSKNRKPLLILSGAILAVLLVLTACFFFYVSDYRHADETAKKAMMSDGTVTVRETSYGYLFDGPSDDNALIFYPGGKVEETAYAPLLKKIASRGVDVCLLKVPFRLAVLDGNAADKALAEHSYRTWYTGGHSLGGVMAANYASSHSDRIKGVVFIAAYPASAMPSGMDALLITASEDKILNRTKLSESRKYLPGKYSEVAIEGGNHCQFGSFGFMKGDGTASVTPDEQQEKTAGAVVSFILPDAK